MTYVNIYAFIVAIVLAVAGCTGAVVMYTENQNTQGLLKEFTSSFEEMTVNTTLTVSNLSAQFQTKLDGYVSQLFNKQTELDSKTNELATVSTEKNVIKESLKSKSALLNSSDSRLFNFTRSTNKGLQKQSIGEVLFVPAKENFTNANTSFSLNTTSGYLNSKLHSQNSRFSCEKSNTNFTSAYSFFATAKNMISVENMNTFITNYVNLLNHAINFTREMKLTNRFTFNASQNGLDTLNGTYLNWTFFKVNQTARSDHWSKYNTSYSQYLAKANAIETYIKSW